MPVLFVVFIVVPLIELMLLLKVGGVIGGFNTLALVILSAFVGSYLLKREGMAAFQRFNQRVNRGELPAAEIATGFALAAGGALLLTPGFITDIVGLVLVLPVSRVFLGRWLMTKLAGNVHIAGFSASREGFETHQGSFGEQASHYQRSQSSHQGDVFEGEVVQDDGSQREITDQQKKN